MPTTGSGSSKDNGSCSPPATSCSAGSGPAGSTASSRDFYIRQLWDGKGSAIVEAMNPAALSTYAGLCGWTLARAHARSGDAAAIANYLGTDDRFDKAMSRFAETYADQNERDYATLKQAVDSGKIKAENA